MTATLDVGRGQTALVDDDDFARVSMWKWHATPALSKTGEQIGWYAKRCARAGERGTSIYLHRVIVGAQRGQMVDHANGDGLDNRRSNLRICSPSQNNSNRVARRGRSGFRGVYARSDIGPEKWEAKLQVQGANHWVGIFDCPTEAARAYDEAARKQHGVFAVLNFPGPGERKA